MDIWGNKVWMPVKFFAGKNPDGTVRTKEGYKNILTDQEIMPEAGHNDDPPYEGLKCTHTSERYRRGYDQINWGKGDIDG